MGKHGISFPIPLLEAGDVQEIPIPGLSIDIPKVGSAGLDVAAGIKGNPDHFEIQAGFNACGIIEGHHACGSDLTGELPVWMLQHTFQFSHYCESIKKEIDIMV